MNRISEIFSRDLFFVDRNSQTVTEVFLNEDADEGRGALVHMYFSFTHLRDCFEQSCGDSELFFQLICNSYEMDDMELEDDPEKIGQAAKELCEPTPFNGLTKETMFGIMKEIGYDFRHAHWDTVRDGDTGEKLAHCSGCGYSSVVFMEKAVCENWKYCPICGARMDE